MVRTPRKAVQLSLHACVSATCFVSLQVMCREAAVRAVKNAMEHTALPGVVSLIPGGHDKVKIKAKIGVPDSVSLTNSILMQVQWCCLAPCVSSAAVGSLIMLWI